LLVCCANAVIDKNKRKPPVASTRTTTEADQRKAIGIALADTPSRLTIMMKPTVGRTLALFQIVALLATCAGGQLWSSSMQAERKMTLRSPRHQSSNIDQAVPKSSKGTAKAAIPSSGYVSYRKLQKPPNTTPAPISISTPAPTPAPTCATGGSCAERLANFISSTTGYVGHLFGLG